MIRNTCIVVLFSLQLRVVHNLMYAMGNMDYADSQRQSSISLEVGIVIVLCGITIRVLSVAT